jgi:hypothetical protein
VASSDYIHGLQEECAQLRKALERIAMQTNPPAPAEYLRAVAIKALARPENERG